MVHFFALEKMFIITLQFVLIILYVLFLYLNNPDLKCKLKQAYFDFLPASYCLLFLAMDI